jgi:hypothetical protein
MDKPETYAKMGTRHRMKTKKTTTQKVIKKSNMDIHPCF